jgi:hypothetical protein
MADPHCAIDQMILLAHVFRKGFFASGRRR